jgi:transposase
MIAKRGGRWRDHRQVLNGILFRVRSGVPWRDLPERYGPWETVYKRFARWPTDGTWARIEAALRTQADGAGELDWHAQIDSTVVRAHQHAAGARKGGSRRSRQAASRRWGGHGWADHQAPHHHRAGAQQATAAQATLLARRPPAQPSAPWPAVTIPDRQAGVSPHHRCGWNIRIAAKLSVGTVKQPQSPCWKVSSYRASVRSHPRENTEVGSAAGNLNRGRQQMVRGVPTRKPRIRLPTLMPVGSGRRCPSEVFSGGRPAQAVSTAGGSGTTRR